MAVCSYARKQLAQPQTIDLYNAVLSSQEYYARHCIHVGNLSGWCKYYLSWNIPFMPHETLQLPLIENKPE